VPKYEYLGETERVFPTLSFIVKKGDVFDGPEGLNALGLSLMTSAKSAPAVVVSKEKTEEENESSENLTRTQECE
jgi:hypothetical protein